MKEYPEVKFILTNKMHIDIQESSGVLKWESTIYIDAKCPAVLFPRDCLDIFISQAHRIEELCRACMEAAYLLPISRRMKINSEDQVLLSRCFSCFGCSMFVLVLCSAPSVPQPVFTITEKAPTRAFSWLKAPTSPFTFKTLLRHYAEQALAPR